MLKKSYYVKPSIVENTLDDSSFDAVVVHSADMVEDYVSVSVFLSEDILDSKNRISQVLRKRNKL